MNDRPSTQLALLNLGESRVSEWCELNDIEAPPLRNYESGEWRVSACAYYRPTAIHLCLARCARPGTAGRSWSWPGYAVDRTPYGVIAHELGHHVDYSQSSRRGSFFGDLSVKMCAATGEPPITTYAPNQAEWFAEMFRLFVTNPDLLRSLRPRTYAAMIDRWRPVVIAPWREVLEGAPPRTIAAAENKISRAAQA